jgi:hypothetical protein
LADFAVAGKSKYAWIRCGSCRGFGGSWIGGSNGNDGWGDGNGKLITIGIKEGDKRIFVALISVVRVATVIRPTRNLNIA